jgi:predicted AAA+ superfamily ATPase
MIARDIIPSGRSFFLFGPRQTGKSTWLASLSRGEGGDHGKFWTVNLLHNDTFYRYLRDPAQFRREAETRIRNGIEWIILDEVQRIPALLSEVHDLMETSSARFILSGSSARKLKRGSALSGSAMSGRATHGDADLLGGRALLRYMHPFTAKELGEDFDLEHALQWGTLPPLLGLNEGDARDTLHSYVELYLREEIQMEGLVRNLGGFTRFIDYAAAYCGEILNYSSIAKETALPIRTVQSYFEVLEDTLIALRLPAWTKSPLKRLVSHPKYYLFDNGLTNAVTHRLSGPLDAAVRGRLFEQFFVQETHRRLDYRRVDSSLHYWRTKDGAEVDLLVEANGKLVMAVEFKSRTMISGADLSGLRSFRDDNPPVPCFLVCAAPEPFRLDFVEVLPWRMYLEMLETLG